MKITVNKYQEETISIEEFADQHDLEMIVTERSPEANKRYYARFKNCETKDGKILCGSNGNGNTVEDAISAYASIISGKLLVYHAYRDDRREIRVPFLQG